MVLKDLIHSRVVCMLVPGYSTVAYVQPPINYGLNSPNKTGNIFLSLRGMLSPMLVECPHCTEEVEIEPANGSVFECPHCTSDFEVESNSTIEVDYSDHYWGLALDIEHPQDCLEYIAHVDGELPKNRLIELSSDSHSEIGGVIFLLLGVFTIPFLLIWVLVHYGKNSGSGYKQFFWVRRWRHYLDPDERAIITITDYKNGSYPTQVAYLEISLRISKISGGSEDPTYYDLQHNSKQRLRFDTRKQAEKCRENILAVLQ